MTGWTASAASGNFSMHVPPELTPLWESGKLILKGSVLAHKDTGQIVAHLQETGIVSDLIGSGVGNLSSLTPYSKIASSIFAGINTFQNEQIKSRLDTMSSVMEQMRLMQVADLAGTAIGIGVTVASTAIILKKMSELNAGLAKVEQKLERLPEEFRRHDLRKILGNLTTRLERMESASSRSNAEPMVRNAEEALHESFNALNDGARQIVSAQTVSPELLATLLNGMAIAGGAQIKALFWLEEPLAARFHSQQQFNRMQSLSMMMPRDVMLGKLSNQRDTADAISSLASSLRLRIASQPALASEILAQGVSSRTYIEAAEAERTEPIMFFSTGRTG